MIVPVATTLISCLEVFSLGAALAVLAALAASASFGGADSTFGSGAGTSDPGIPGTGDGLPETVWICGSIATDYMGTTWYYVWLAVCCIPVQIPTPTFSGDFGFSGVASLVLDSAEKLLRPARNARHVEVGSSGMLAFLCFNSQGLKMFEDQVVIKKQREALG